jgi:hypothetical protein
MSHDGVLSLFLCCGECIEWIECCQKNKDRDRQEHYRELENYRLIYDYQITDDRFMRNKYGDAICGWCNGNIGNNGNGNNKKAIVQCVSCSKFMGHMLCYNKKCPYCICV